MAKINRRTAIKTALTTTACLTLPPTTTKKTISLITDHIKPLQDLGLNTQEILKLLHNYKAGSKLICDINHTTTTIRIIDQKQIVWERIIQRNKPDLLTLC